MNWYYDVFGPDRFFVELQQHNIKEITDLNRKLVEMGTRYSAKYIATNDVHYINQGDSRLQDILLAIQTNALATAEEVHKTLDELAKSFPEGFTYSVPFDTTNFVKVSIREVVKTLGEVKLNN